MTAAVVVAVLMALSIFVMWRCAYACGLMDGARKMAEQQERDASLKSAARRLDAEWDRTHGHAAKQGPT